MAMLATTAPAGRLPSAQRSYCGPTCKVGGALPRYAADPAYLANPGAAVAESAFPKCLSGSGSATAITLAPAHGGWVHSREQGRVHSRER